MRQIQTHDSERYQDKHKTKRGYMPGQKKLKKKKGNWKQDGEEAFGAEKDSRRISAPVTGTKKGFLHAGHLPFTLWLHEVSQPAHGPDQVLSGPGDDSA
jgi:hypothetical protein